MRDPKRIERILTKLEKLWEKNPDMRFYQLVSNLYKGDMSDPFYVEDTRTEEWIDEWLERYEEKNIQ